MLGVSVRREDAEGLRKRLAALHLVDKGRSIVDDGDRIVIPILSVPDSVLLDEFHGSLIEKDFTAREVFSDPIRDVREIAEVPDELRTKIPAKWERIGDIVTVRLDPALDGYEEQVGRAYAHALNAKAVLRETGPIQGEFRKPTVRTIFGSDTETIHVENHIRYKLDVSAVMFSSGNQEERLRMAGLRCDNETVVDMFAGIGYFSLPLAVYQRPREILACEINPKAHGYLKENIRINKVESKVQPVLGDNRDLKGEAFADRVIMGYVKTTHEFLPAAMRILKGGGIIHYHETCPDGLVQSRPLQRLRDAAAPASVQLLRSKTIKSYAPGIAHVVLDVRIVRPS